MAVNVTWRKLCAAAICALGGAVLIQPVQTQPALAQGATAPSAATSGAATSGADGKILDTISVTATRNPIKSFEYPGIVTVIGREDIQTRMPSSPDDILRYVPNVEFTGGPRRTGEVPSIRGFSGPDTVVILDGARQNFGSAHDGRFFVDPSLLKQVEVLRGAASALYGSGGTGGVIEFRTVDAADFLAPGETAGMNFSTGYQTVNDEYVGTLTAFTTPAKGLDLVGSVTRRESGTIELGDGTELTNTDDDILAGLVKGSLSFAGHHRIEGSLVRFSNDAREPNDGQGAGGDSTVDKEIRSTTLRAAYSYKNPADKLFDVNLVVYHTDQQADELRLDDLGNGPAGELLKRDVNTIGARIDNRSRINFSDALAVTFTYGGEVIRDKQDGAAGTSERDGVPDAKSEFYGLFGQAEVTLAQPFGLPGDMLVIPGIRFDDYKTTSALASDNQENEISPRIGVSYLPNDWLLSFVNYGHAFRAPTFDELYLTGTHFQIPVGPGVVNRFVSNPDLKPQRTRTLEVGAGLTFDGLVQTNDRFQIKGSHFWIWGRDFIDLAVTQPSLFVDCNPFIPGNCDGTTNSTNVPKARLTGAEVEASYENRLLVLSFGFSTIDGENQDTHEKLGVLTPDQFTFSAGYKLNQMDALIGWRFLVAGKFDKVNDADEQRDGYAVHDLYFTWQPRDNALKGLRVDLGIDNLFDKAYARVFTGATEAGRNFKALVSYSLKW